MNPSQPPALIPKETLVEHLWSVSRLKHQKSDVNTVAVPRRILTGFPSEVLASTTSARIQVVGGS